MRCGEGFVNINVHHVETHVAGTARTEHRIEVGAVVIHQAAAVMDKFCDFRDALFKQSQRIRIGHHHAGDFFSLLFDDGFQVFYIDCSVGQTLYFEYFQTANGG